MKVSPNGTKLLTCTYFGGISDDAVASIAIAGPDVVWVAGSTFSKNFPIVGPALKKSIYLLDSFVTKVDLGAVPIVCWIPRASSRCRATRGRRRSSARRRS